MYYQPDPTWESFNANSEEEYIRKFVVKGKFHSKVHEDVIKSYSVVEHIMALSYYHYPMYDVALQKLLGIFEMAVKLRSQQVGIDMEYTLKNGTKRKKELSKLIDELVQKELIPELKNIMHHVRDIRNIFAHPDQYSLFGTLSLPVLTPVVNLLNQLFLPQEHHIENNQILFRAKENFNISETDLFILHHQNQLTLVYAPKLLNTFKVGNYWVSAISFQPVILNKKKLLSEHRNRKGIIRFVKDVEITKIGIGAFDMEIQAQIEIKQTDLIENYDRFKIHINELNDLNPIESSQYTRSTDYEIDRAIQKFIYDNCWNME